MKFSEQIFGKKINEISFQDLKVFFEIGKRRIIKIELKSGEIKIEDIYREVCAFLNTDGGILVIGTPREQKITINKNTTKKFCVGDLIPSPFKGKGWLTQKISANISPFPIDLDIHEILTESGNYFIIEVPQSLNPPHQCSTEGKYYIRLEDEAKPAPHGIVQSLFFKRQQPNIIANVDLFQLKDKPIDEIEVEIEIKNDSNVPTDNISFIIEIKNVYDCKSEEHHENSHGFRKKGDNNFSLQNNFKQVLINKILLPIKFSMIHKYQPILIAILVWGKDFGIYENYILWDPVKFETIASYKTGGNNNITLEELMDKQFELIKNTL